MKTLCFNAWMKVADGFLQLSLAMVASGLLILGVTLKLVRTDTTQPTMASARVHVDSLTLELAETEGVDVKPAALAQVDAVATIPQPTPQTDLPILSDEQSDFILPQPPAMEVPRLPDLPTFDLPLTPPEFELKTTEHNLPEITLPPLQSLPEPPTESLEKELLTPPPSPRLETPPAPTTQRSQGATAKVKAHLVSDLSQLMKRYPPEALKHKWQGKVILRLTIGEGGSLEKVEIERSSGYDVLDKEAKRMMEKARFEGGPDVILQQVEFNLQKSRK